MRLSFVLPWFFAGITGLAHGKAPEARRIDIAVTQDGFEPKRIEVKKGEPVTLVFTRKTEKTCAKDIVVYLEGDKKIERHLPLDEPVTVTATFTRAGELGYACSMKMLGGAIVVK